jgi:hypothetical protein
MADDHSIFGAFSKKYAAHNATEMLHPGWNSLAIQVNSDALPPAVIAGITLDREDGAIERAVILPCHSASSPGFKIENDQLRYNQFGGAIGRPIWKNKTFFFGSIQALRVRTSTQERLKFPTAAELGGDFTGIDPITGTTFATIYDPVTGLPFPENPIDPARFSAYAKKMIAAGLFMTSNCDSCVADPNLAVNFIGNAPGVENDTQYLARIDHFSEKDQLQGGLVIEPHTYPQVYSPNPISRLGLTNRVCAFNVGEVHLFTQNLLNEFHLGYTRNFSGFGQDRSIDAKSEYPFHSTPDSLP